MSVSHSSLTIITYHVRTSACNFKFIVYYIFLYCRTVTWRFSSFRLERVIYIDSDIEVSMKLGIVIFVDTVREGGRVNYPIRLSISVNATIMCMLCIANLHIFSSVP